MKNRFLQAWTAAFLMWAVVAAAGASTTTSGERRSETRTVAEFEAIELAGPMKLVLRQAEQQRVQLEAGGDVLARIETRVEPRNGVPTLVIRLRKGDLFQWRSGEIRVHIDTVRLTSLAATSSGSIDVGPLQTPALRLAIAGSGDVRLAALRTDRLEASIAGSGDIKAAGQAQSIKLSIAGSGDADLLGLAADEVSVSIAGSGDAQVSADRSLAVSIAGSGDVRYLGQVSAVKSSIVGSGSVRRR